jgi:hypothetical protein
MTADTNSCQNTQYRIEGCLTHCSVDTHGDNMCKIKTNEERAMLIMSHDVIACREATSNMTLAPWTIASFHSALLQGLVAFLDTSPLSHRQETIFVV